MRTLYPMTPSPFTLFTDPERWFAEPFAFASVAGSMIGFDLAESEDSYHVKLALPGLSPDVIHVRLEGRDLIVRATLGEEGGVRWLSFRRRSQPEVTGEVYERITLPGPADADRAQAEYLHGILSIQVPKLTATGRPIPVRGARQLTAAGEQGQERHHAGIGAKVRGLFSRLTRSRRTGSTGSRGLPQPA